MINVNDFLKLPDTKISEKQIQQAIDVCEKEGGGTVYVPSGEWYCSSIELKSNVYLFLEHGAILKLTNQNKLGNNLKTTDESFINCDYTGNPPELFIWANSAKNCGIIGDGIIDGNERQFYGEIDKYHIEGSFYPRIPLIFFENCCQVTFRGITLKNSAFWSLHMVGCSDVDVCHVRILNNLKMANSDGIDPDHCKNIRISDCYIQGGDDCIVLKNTSAFKKYGDECGIIVENCILCSTSSAIKIGTESVNNFENIHFSNCIIVNSNRGIAIQLRDEGCIRNLLFENISIQTRCFSNKWWGNGEPIYITAFDRNEQTHSGKIKDIKFQNITCNSQNGVFIAAGTEGLIENVFFEGVNLYIEKNSKWNPKGYDYRPSVISLYKSKGALKTYYNLNASNVKFNNCKTHVDENMSSMIKLVDFYDN